MHFDWRKARQTSPLIPTCFALSCIVILYPVIPFLNAPSITTLGKHESHIPERNVLFIKMSSVVWKREVCGGQGPEVDL